MFNKKLFFISICLIFISCATPVSNQYRTAQQFEMMGRETEALTIYKQLCLQTKNDKYCSAYNKLKVKLTSRFIEDINNIISSYKDKYSYVPIPVFEKIDQEMSKLRDIASAQEIEMIEQEILHERKLSEEREQEILSKLKQLISEDRYNEAFDLLNNNKFIHPEKFNLELNHLTKIIIANLLPKGVLLAKEEKWHELRPIVELLNKVKPDDPNIKQLYKQTINNDSINYYIAKAKVAQNIKDFDQALKYYKLAMQYYPEEKNKIEPCLQELLAQLSVFYLESAQAQIEQGLLAQAYFFVKKAYRYLHELPLNKRSLIDPTRYGIEEYYKRIYLKAKEFEIKRRYGISYFYYNMLFDLNPNYPNIKQDISRLEDLIKDRAIKKLAILTFKSPKSNPDAGTIITSSLIMKLQEYLKGDIKLIEREAQPQLIKELEIKLMSGGTLKLAGIDLFIVGEVRSYKVETMEQMGKKTIMVKTGTKMILNPEYEKWLQQPDNIRKNSPPPDKYIKQPINKFISYNIKYIRKIGVVDVAYRIVDIQGKVIYANSYESKKTFNGESTEGVEVGDFRIPFKMADLPGDSEIIELAQKEVVEEIAKQIQKLFIHSENKYLKQAEFCKKRDDYVGAIENYANAIVIMKAKGLPTSKIRDKQIMLLDAIGV